MNKLLRKLSLGVVCLLMTAFICSCQSSQAGGTFEVGKNTFLLNGKPFVVKAAEVHYPRIPEPYWEQRILSCKALGMNTLCLYVFWNLHEQQPGKFDFSGNNDIAKFCRLAQKHGMYVIVRPGRSMGRMGNGWIALVVTEERRCTVTHAGSLLYGTCWYFHE